MKIEINVLGLINTVCVGINIGLIIWNLVVNNHLLASLNFMVIILCIIAVILNSEVTFDED